jgi:allantoate deiminase
MSIEHAIGAISPERLAERLQQLALIGRGPSGGITRLALSSEERDAQDLVAFWLSQLGYISGRDTWGNLLANPPLGSRVLTGSHLDTVPDGGAFDGALGVVVAAEAAEAMHRAGLTLLPRIVAWTGEEGPRFGRTLFGSAAALGLLSDADWRRVDEDGITARDALVAFLADGMPRVRLDTDKLTAYIEVHMEQGDTLARERLPLGVVTGIAGATHASLRVIGEANHAGTTRMEDRRDALAGAAEIIVEIERLARRMPDLVATVGSIEVFPGAQNVIPGAVEATIDTRSPHDEARRRLIDDTTRAARALGARRSLGATVKVHDDIPTATLNGDIVEVMAGAAERVVGRVHQLPSWAVHDAQNCVSRGIPTGMLFVRSTNGSHNPAEHVDTQDASLGVAALIRALYALDTARQESD